MIRDFVAIDFETANQHPCSVCSVGIVIVKDGEAVDSYYSLIHPEPDYYSYFCQRVHGLSKRETDDAPSFPEVWNEVMSRISEVFPEIEYIPFVAHNARFDEGCLKAVLGLTRWTILIITSTTHSPQPAVSLVIHCPITNYTPLQLPVATT